MSAGTRDRAMTAAVRSFVDRGVLATTIDDVRVVSGVSVGSLYHHFGDKAGLAQAVYLDALGRYQAAFLDELARHDDLAAGCAGTVRMHLAWCAEHRERAAFLFTQRAAVDDGAALAALNRPFFAQVLGWWRAHARSTAAELPLDLIYALWLGPAQEYCRAWLRSSARRVPRSAVETLAAAAARTFEEDEDP